jgi:hypothetical protein
MCKRRLVAIVPTALAVVFFGSVVFAAITSTVAVYPGHLQDWQTQTTPGMQPTPASTPSVSFVFGPTPPPLGRGSAQLSVGSDGSASAQLRQPDYAGTALPNPSPSPDSFPAANELTALTYHTYVQVGGSASQAPYIILDVNYSGGSTVDDHLVFEPQYQIVGFCPSNPQGPVAPGVWQTWDAFNGCWYSTSGTAGSGPGANVKPLTAFSAAQPNAKIVNANGGSGGVRIVAGLGGVVGGGAASDWANFVGNVDDFEIGVGFNPDTGPNVTAYDFEPKAPPTLSSRGVIISELRNSGPGPGPCVVVSPSVNCAPSPFGPVSGGDEYVELYNTTDNDIAVADQVNDTGSPGWALVSRGATCVDPPVVVATIPNGTVIPARGHYLLAGAGYSLGSYPAGDGSAQAPQTTATPDQTYTGTIGGDVDIGLFNTTDSTFFDLSHRLDAVGFNNGSGGTCDLLTEGTPLPNTRNSTQQYAFVRKEPLSGGVQDTNNNAADFVEVSTQPHTNVGDNPSPVLGAPGPQNTSSPVNRNDVISANLTSPAAGQSAPPNRERHPATTPTPEPCSNLGTLLLRRSFTNNSGAFVSRLRFRVIDVTTVNSADESSGGQQAILHVRSSSPETLTGVPGRGTVQVFGLHDEQATLEDPTQCGGLNNSLSDDSITLGTPLAPGATIDVSFLLGVEQTGHFKFFVNVEALENSAPVTPMTPAAPAKSRAPIALPGTAPPPGPAGTSDTLTPPVRRPMPNMKRRPVPSVVESPTPSVRQAPTPNSTQAPKPPATQGSSPPSTPITRRGSPSDDAPEPVRGRPRDQD